MSDDQSCLSCRTSSSEIRQSTTLQSRARTLQWTSIHTWAWPSPRVTSCQLPRTVESISATLWELPGTEDLQIFYEFLAIDLNSLESQSTFTSLIFLCIRSNGTGQVVIFVKCHSELLKVQMVISGDNFASQFGYALTTADVNSDGFADLFVAAPFYHDKHSGGGVYYYRNTDQGLDTVSEPVLLTGASESRFGFALSSAGDVNSDGFEDLVVGAPYEGRGAVYLYQGSSQGLRTKPSQVIHAEDVPGAPLNTFGYSLSGGLDMDLNNHSDVLVGAYQRYQPIKF